MIQIILMIRTIEKVLFENNNNFIKDLNIDEDEQKHENTMIDTYNEDKNINSSNSNQEYMKNNRNENNDINKINNKQSCEQKYSIL